MQICDSVHQDLYVCADYFNTNSKITTDILAYNSYIKYSALEFKEIQYNKINGSKVIYPGTSADQIDYLNLNKFVVGYATRNGIYVFNNPINYFTQLNSHYNNTTIAHINGYVKCYYEYEKTKCYAV
jgi:hypothetical protein